MFLELSMGGRENVNGISRFRTSLPHDLEHALQVPQQGVGLVRTDLPLVTGKVQQRNHPH